MIKTLCVLPNDPIQEYVQKGEIKPRYYNPCTFFDKVHILSLSQSETIPEKVQTLVGSAKLVIHPIGRPSPLSFPVFFHKVRKLVEEISPDVIRAFNPRQCGALAVYAGKKLGIPTVLSIHLEYDDQRKYDKRLLLRMVKLLESYSLRNVDVAICVTEYLQQYAKKHGAKHCVTIYNKVYTEQFSPPGSAGVSPASSVHSPGSAGVSPASSERFRHEKLTILSVGRLDKQKYQECLIRAIRNLDVKLILIGQGELEEYLKHLVTQLDMTHKVEFIPSVPNTEIQQYYWKADIFALATHYEGFCIPVLEAMAAGLPVVASQTPPLPEVIGKSGIILDNSPEKFEHVFRELINNPERRKQLGQEARKRAEKVNGTIMEHKEAELYRSLLKMK